MYKSSTAKTATEPMFHCTGCFSAKVHNLGDQCPNCTKLKEVDAVLERTGIDKTTVEFTQPASVPPAVAGGEVRNTAPDWLDDLKAQADAPKTETSLPARDLESVANSLTEKLVPQFGEVLRRYDTAALSQYGFPPAIEALLTKTKIDDMRASLVLQAFEKAFQVADKWEREAFAIVVTDESQADLITEANRLWKLVRESRIQAEAKRKELKEPSLREGQLIDGISNIWKERIVPIETHLHKQAKFAEEREKERQAQLRTDRWNMLKLFVDKEPSVDLGKLPADEWDLLYKGAVRAYEERKAAERAEEERRQKELADLRANAEALRLENERIERERKEAADRAAEANRIAEESRLKAEAAQAELKRQEEEREAERRRIAAEQELMRQKIEREAELRRLAPDKEKLDRYFREIQQYSSDNRPTEFAERKSEQLCDEFYASLADLVNRYAIKASSL